MVRDIVRDVFFLSRPSEQAGREDLPLSEDLLDTLRANRERCVGMAANMIGSARRVIVFDEDGTLRVMFNPEIIKKAQPFEAEEGCLSLDGTRKTTRYKVIKVRYQNEKMEVRLKTYRDFTAQIIQHECDHLEGKII